MGLRDQAAKDGYLIGFEPQHLTMVLQAVSTLYAPRDGDDAPSADGLAVALGLALAVLPECVKQAPHFKTDEATRITSACSKLRLHDRGSLPNLAWPPPE